MAKEVDYEQRSKVGLYYKSVGRNLQEAILRKPVNGAKVNMKTTRKLRLAFSSVAVAGALLTFYLAFT